MADTTNPLLVPDPAPAPPADLASQQAQLVAVQKKAFIATAAAVKATLRTQMTLVFANTQLTPQQAFDAYGTNGKWLLTMKAACDAFLQAIDPTYTPTPAPKTLTDDGTGRIVVSDLP